MTSHFKHISLFCFSNLSASKHTHFNDQHLINHPLTVLSSCGPVQTNIKQLSKNAHHQTHSSTYAFRCLSPNTHRQTHKYQTHSLQRLSNISQSTHIIKTSFHINLFNATRNTVTKNVSGLKSNLQKKMDILACGILLYALIEGNYPDFDYIYDKKGDVIGFNTDVDIDNYFYSDSFDNVKKSMTCKG